MRTSSIPYSCWECGSRMKMEFEVNTDKVKMMATGMRECVEDWRNFIVFAFECFEILKEPYSLDAEANEYAAEVLVKYFEFILYIKED